MKLIALILLLSAPAYSAVVNVQNSSMTYVDGNSEAQSNILTVTAGNTLVVACSESDATCPQIVTDSQGNVYSMVTSALHYDDASTAARCATVWVATVTTTGSNVVSCIDHTNWNSGQTGGVVEYSGVNVSDVVDVYSSSATVTPTANPTAGSMSVASVGNMIFSYLYSYDDPSGNGNGTERLRYAGNSVYNCVQDAVASSAGAYSASWTATAQFYPFTMIQVSLNAAGGGASTGGSGWFR